MKKLYEITISTTALVLAESAAEARSSVREILETEYKNTIEVSEAGVVNNRPVYPQHWTGDSLVYGADEDTTAADAFEAEIARRAK